MKFGTIDYVGAGNRCTYDYKSVKQNKVAPKVFLLFSRQPLGILIWNFTDLCAEMF